MSIQMILLDLDGTLLTSDKRLSPGNRAALERAAARGVHIVPSTGRFYSGMPQVVRELPFVRYVVSINGALIYDAAEDKAYFQVNVQSDNAYQPDKLQFQVNAVLCDKSKDNRDVDLSGTVRSMGTKLEALSGSGGRVRQSG